MLFTGSAVALITPFTDDDEVDYEAYDKILNFHLENKTDALVVCGTTGEAATMSEEEKIDLISYTAKKVGGRLPIIAGTGSNNTAQAADFSKRVGEIEGVDGLLVVTPYYNKATKEGLYKHFETIASATDKDIILYTVPSRTGVNIDLDTVIRLAKIENIVAIKDASGDMGYTASLVKNLPEDFGIYSGNDDLTFAMLALGIDGSISVFANICPEENHDIYELFKKGDIEGSRKIHLTYMDLIENLFVEVNPVPVKAAASMMGLCGEAIRLPLTRAEDKTQKSLREKMEELKIC